jgi:hypothetical protein
LIADDAECVVYRTVAIAEETSLTVGNGGPAGVAILLATSQWHEDAGNGGERVGNVVRSDRCHIYSSAARVAKINKLSGESDGGRVAAEQHENETDQ